MHVSEEESCAQLHSQNGPAESLTEEILTRPTVCRRCNQLSAISTLATRRVHGVHVTASFISYEDYVKNHRGCAVLLFTAAITIAYCRDRSAPGYVLPQTGRDRGRRTISRPRLLRKFDVGECRKSMASLSYKQTGRGFVQNEEVVRHNHHRPLRDDAFAKGVGRQDPLKPRER